MVTKDARIEPLVKDKINIKSSKCKIQFPRLKRKCYMGALMRSFFSLKEKSNSLICFNRKNKALRSFELQGFIHS